MQKNIFKDLKILDHTVYLLGSYASQVFADLGAEVIKIENPRSGGDPGRTVKPFINGVSYYHSALDRNKKSVTLNLKSKEGKEAYLLLLKEADIVFENFRPGVMKRLGIDYEVEKTIKPDIIHCAISAFGQDDPRSLLALHDMNFQAMCGYMYVNGPRHGAIHLADMASAMVSVQDMMAALLQRSATGEGAFCDVKMFDSIVWWNAKLDSKYWFDNKRFEPGDLAFKTLGTYIWETKDGGHVVVCISEEKFLDEFIRLTGMEELRPHMFAKPKEQPKLFAKMEAFFKSKTLDEWKEWIGDKDICATCVMNKEEAVDYILEQNTGLMEVCDYPLTGKTLQTRIPHDISSIPLVPLHSAMAPPALGEQNLEVLEQVGYTRAEINEMADRGACGPIS